MKQKIEATLEKFAEEGYMYHVIDWLEENKFIPQKDYNSRSISEQEFEDALNKLKDKYISVTKEEEQTIINIAKRF